MPFLNKVLSISRSYRKLQEERQAFEAKKQRYESERRGQEERNLQRQQQAREEEQRQQQYEETYRKQQEALRKARLQQTSHEALRGLGDLIRTRHQLDITIWSLKGARSPDRPLVLEKMQQADSILHEILDIVEAWDESLWSADEWQTAQQIKERLYKDNKRWWGDDPPWNHR